ncbi:hypothetical protein MVEN_01974700 [Mycena venus]|uniref:Uncharacterized protein n=1 Tax=Mycena venus TaxID=2733690 RepID=A0A8H6XCU1_9AGAR|nr:hypothetical protein MVEN_01974700 [Mycena venus]
MVSPLNGPPAPSSAAPEASFLAVLHQDDAHAQISLASLWDLLALQPCAFYSSSTRREDESSSPPDLTRVCEAERADERWAIRAMTMLVLHTAHLLTEGDHSSPPNQCLPNAPEYDQMAVSEAPNHSQGRLASPHLKSHQRRSVSRLLPSMHPQNSLRRLLCPGDALQPHGAPGNV